MHTRPHPLRRQIQKKQSTFSYVGHHSTLIKPASTCQRPKRIWLEKIHIYVSRFFVCLILQLRESPNVFWTDANNNMKTGPVRPYIGHVLRDRGRAHAGSHGCNRQRWRRRRCAATCPPCRPPHRHHGSEVTAARTSNRTCGRPRQRTCTGPRMPTLRGTHTHLSSGRLEFTLAAASAPQHAQAKRLWNTWVAW